MDVAHNHLAVVMITGIATRSITLSQGSYLMKTQTPVSAERSQQTNTSTTDTLQQAKGELSFADNRADVAMQRRVMGLMNNSPQAMQHQTRMTLLNNSPQTLEQRKQQTAWSGASIQRMADEEPLQGQFMADVTAQREEAAVAKPNNTGLPDQLKSGVESLSGMSLDHVKVHYNSFQPAQLNAHAYAQGSDIHVAPGQEQHLPHEAWHVVQQAQGRVKPTMQMKGNVPVNDDAGLEAEADVMGAKALQMQPATAKPTTQASTSSTPIAQMLTVFEWRTLQERHAARLNTDLFQWESIQAEESYPAVFDLMDALASVPDIKEAPLSTYSGQIDTLNGTYKTKIKLVKNAPKAPKVSSDKTPFVINLDKLEVVDTDGALLTNFMPLTQDQTYLGDPLEHAKPGYVGIAIVYFGEDNAKFLIQKYLSGSQGWGEAERKSRLGVTFAVNAAEGLTEEANNTTTATVRTVAQDAATNAKSIASTNMLACTWGYSYKEKGGSLAMTSTKEMRQALTSGQIGERVISWVTGAKEAPVPSSKEAAIVKLNELRKANGVPYGHLRGIVSGEAKYVENRLKQNNANPVYLHSIDADAPNFETLKEKEDGSGGQKKILEAYDEILEKGGTDQDIIIGGYNLLAQEDQYASPEDYKHTVRSNVVDLAIRQAVHSVAPEMTYPTEPNFLIKSDTYRKLEAKEKGGKSPWGRLAVEGRNLYNAALQEPDKPKTTYDPLASVPTGVKAGGARLKIQTGKVYDKDSVLGAPQGSGRKVGDTASVEEQYILQAQSWAGGSRLATAYMAVLEARKVKGASKAIIAQAFAVVEQMVSEIANKGDVNSVDISAVLAQDADVFKAFPMHPIVKAIQVRLKQLQTNPDFDKL